MEDLNVHCAVTRWRTQLRIFHVQLGDIGMWRSSRGYDLRWKQASNEAAAK
jgi:hypothetical protein